MKKHNQTHQSVSLPKHIVQRLRVLADSRGKPMSTFATSLLKQALERLKSPEDERRDYERACANPCRRERCRDELHEAH
jgi:CopG antitoxin of type II toxin-antitoxin system